MSPSVDHEKKELQHGDPTNCPAEHSRVSETERTSSDEQDPCYGEELSTGEPRSEEPATSPDQPDNPPKYSIYTLWEKRFIVLAAALSAFFSPLTAQIYLPALPVLAKEFHVTQSQINLTVTTYMIFQGVTPMFIGGFADSAGRRPAFVICFVVYIAANIGLALSKNYASVLAVRCLQSAGSSTTVALCQAVVADIITSAERGQYIGITVIPIVLAPSLGPVLGGVLSQYLGWRSIFWFLTIASAINLAALLFFFPETCRRIVGDGSVRPPLAYRTFRQMLVDRRRRRRAAAEEASGGLKRTTSTASAAPTLRLAAPDVLGSVVLLCQKELGLLLFYSAVAFAGFYAVATAMPSQLSSMYGLNDLQIGLMYLPLAGGSIASALVAGPAINRNYRRHAARLGLAVDKTRQMDLAGFPIERARLEVGMPLLALSAAALVCWGWVMQERGGLPATCVLLFVMGAGLTGFSNTSNVLIVDIHPGRAGAAVAANNLTRCLLGAASSAVIVPMINAMGSGWAFTLIGLLYVVFSPVLLLIMKKGVAWRAEEAEKEERKRRRKEEAGAGVGEDGVQDGEREDRNGVAGGNAGGIGSETKEENDVEGERRVGGS